MSDGRTHRPRWRHPIIVPMGHTKRISTSSRVSLTIEGDLALRRFQGAGERLPSRYTGIEQANDAPPGKAKTKRRARVKDKAVDKEATRGVVIESPRLDKNLDTGGLEDFFAQFAPTNNSEKILTYLKFIVEELNIPSPNTDQVFTCFKATGQKIPEAFPQAFYTASSRHGFIDFKSASDISITIAGENHFNRKLKRKTAE